MPRDLFTEELLLEKTERHVYEPGIAAYDESLPQLLLDAYKAVEKPSEKRKQLVKEFSTLLEANTEANFETNQFLEHMLREAEESETIRFSQNFDEFFSPLIQALYNNGHKKLFLDFIALEGSKTVSGIGCDLKGKEDDPLILMVRNGYSHRVAENIENVTLALGGYVMVAGQGAKNSTIMLSKNSQYLMIAYGAEDCDVYIDEESYMLHPGEDDFSEDELKNELYDAILGGQKTISETLKDEGFFERKNKLFHKGEDDEWQEVTPE